MKKFLLTAAMLVMGFVATFAQNWEVGQDITADLEWGNLSFTNNPMDYWETNKANGSVTTTGGAFENYNGSTTELFQTVNLPLKGKYKLECQGYYRGGSSGGPDDGTSTSSSETNNPTVSTSGANQCAYNYLLKDDGYWNDNAYLSVINQNYNEKTKTYTDGHWFKAPLMPRLYEAQQERIFNEPVPVSGNRPDDNSNWNRSDYYYDELGCYGPTSFPGSLAWFESGKYLPKDGYNSVEFFVTKAGKVKVGVKRVGNVDGDTFFVTDFKMYYMGAVSEDDELMVLQGDCDDLLTELAEIRDDENNKGYVSKRLEDELMSFEMYNGNDPYSFNLEEAKAAKEELDAMKAGATKALNDVVSLKSAIVSASALVENTDFDGKAALEAALEAAKTSISPTYAYVEGKDDWDIFEKLTENLNAARLNYLKSSPMGEDGSWDFTAFVSFPWFCNPEFEPTWDAENKVWVPNEAALALGWGTWNDVDGTATGKDEKTDDDGTHHDEASPIADQVAFNGDKNSVGQWYQVNNGLVLYWNDKLTCVKKWDTPHADDGEREVAQNIEGVPAGFYKLKALGQTWFADWDQNEKLCKSRIYIQSGDQISESSYLVPPTGQWDWFANDIKWWQELETDMIQVTDGTLKIAAHDNGFVAWTGFRLYYYGETPNFTAMLKQNLDAAKEAAVALPFKGDQKAANAILATIPETISDGEAYEAASKTVAQANDYINKAKAATTNWKTPDNFMDLAIEKAEKDEQVGEFLITASDAASDFAKSEDAVYTGVADYDNRYNAYKAYVTYRESLGDYLKEKAVADLISNQNAYLIQNFATPEKLAEFKSALAIPYNQAVFTKEGIDQATLAAPKNITFLMINPYFSEGPEKGWTANGTGVAQDGEFALDEEGHQTLAELWDRGAFTFSQVVSGLPAGTYELRTRALYRNGGGVNQDGFDAYVAAGGEENWEGHNAELFMKSGKTKTTSYVKSIYSLRATEYSWTQYVSKWDHDPSDGMYYPNTIRYMAGTIDESEKSEGINYTEESAGQWFFDGKISAQDEDYNEVTYYFPTSTQGFYSACKKNPDAYNSSVLFYLPETGNIEVGISKNEGVKQDWVIMEQFELFYLGKVAPTAINEVVEATTEGEGAVEYYSIDGVKLNAPQAGLNIVKYANGVVRKVFINK